MASFSLRLFNLKYGRNVRFCSTARKLAPRGVSPIHMKQLENLMINRVLDNKENINADKWLKIREDLFASLLPVTKHNIDAAIVDRCKEDGNFEAAVTYIEFLLSTNQKINPGTINKFFEGLAEVGRPLSEKETNLTFKLYDDLRVQYPILDPRTATNCILGLSLTKRWREYKELLLMCGSETASVSKYEVIASAAFNHDDPDEGWEVIKSIAPNASLSTIFSDSYLKYCIRHSKNTQEVESHMSRLFQFYSEHAIYPNFESIIKYGEHLEKVGGWNANKTRLDPNGACVVCGHQLDTIQITQEDFNLLKEAFFSKVVVGKDVYNNTTPGELKYFQEFVERTKPYDVVIDGLNVSYISGRKDKSKHAQDLMMVVRAFVKENKKIFILGRKHMNRWRTQEMDYVKQHAHLFLANDLTNDDTFLLHAALSSGIQTYFCSRDLMRQHNFTLANDRIRRIFRSWQMTQQICPTSVGGIHNKQILLAYPTKIATIAQMNPNGDWHIPYRQNEPVGQLTSPLWLCLKKKRSPQ